MFLEKTKEIGGTLIQDIEGSERHRRVDNKFIIKEKSILWSILKKPWIIGKCAHHQAIGKLAKNFKVNCLDEDYMIHGIEHKDPNHWVLAVQWHPERTQESEDNNKIFGEFIRQASEYKSKTSYFS